MGIQEIQQATASEPLTLEEEFSMQQSWRRDADKLTFIACLPLSTSSSNTLSDNDDAPGRMIGDTNLFLRNDDDDEENDNEKDITLNKEEKHDPVIGEIELMIAEKQNQGKGFGRAALLGFLWYVMRHEEEILQEFVQSTMLQEGTVLSNHEIANRSTKERRIKCLSVKIGQDNSRSLALFESLGFEKTSQEPNYFGEFELRNYNLNQEELARLSDRYGVKDYRELDYRSE